MDPNDSGRRADWPVVRRRLDEVSDDISGQTTAAERLGMMWELAVSAWRLAGREIPDYRREDTPGRVIRPKTQG